MRVERASNYSAVLKISASPMGYFSAIELVKESCIGKKGPGSSTPMRLSYWLGMALLQLKYCNDS